MGQIPMMAAPGTAPTTAVPMQYLPPRPIAQPSFNDEMAQRQQQIAQFNQGQQMARAYGATSPQQTSGQLNADPMPQPPTAEQQQRVEQLRLNAQLGAAARPTATLAPRSPTQVSQPTAAPRNASVPSQVRSMPSSTPSSTPMGSRAPAPSTSVNRSGTGRIGRAMSVEPSAQPAAYKRAMTRMS